VSQARDYIINLSIECNHHHHYHHHYHELHENREITTGTPDTYHSLTHSLPSSLRDSSLCFLQCLFWHCWFGHM